MRLSDFFCQIADGILLFGAIYKKIGFSDTLIIRLSDLAGGIKEHP